MSRADLVFTCSAADRDAAISRFNVEPEKVSIAPNGVDLGTVLPISAEERLQAKKKLGLEDKVVALFLGARWTPNVEAAHHVLSMARQNPRITFLIVGGVGASLPTGHNPENVIITGMVDDLAPWFAAADIAINPMENGSGSNIKMFEYCAAGFPIVTTAFGARGIDDHSGKVLTISSIPDMPKAIVALAQSSDLDERRIAARALAHKYDWFSIARQISDRIIAAVAIKMR